MSQKDKQSEGDGPASKKQKIDVSENELSRNVILTRKQASEMKFYDPSAPSPFALLPNEVVENIFTLLDRESLLKSVLVNKRWNKVIGNSMKAMKKIALTVNLTRGAENIELKKLERNYQVINFEGADKKLPKNISDALKKVGANVKTIDYDGGFGLNFFDVLNCLPNIERITVNDCSFLDVHEDFQPPNLAKLKTLEASFCENLMLPNAQLVDLNVTFGLISNVNWNSFTRFLSSQTRLSKLVLSSVLPLFIPDEVTFPPLKCKLRFLSVHGVLEGNSQKKEEFVKMLAPSVTKLTLSHLHITTRLMGNILRNFKSLEFLLLHYVNIFGEEESNENSNSSLKNLAIRKISFSNNASLVKFFSLFKSISLLHLQEFIHPTDEITSDDVKTATSAMENIKIIGVTGTIGLLRHASFKNLGSLMWKKFDAIEDMNWTEFIKNNPKLSRILLEITNDRLDCKALMKSAGLRESMVFAILGDFKLTKQRLKIFMTKDVLIQLNKSSLLMSEEEFNEIVGDRQQFFCLSEPTLEM